VEPQFGLIHDRETVVRATSLRAATLTLPCPSRRFRPDCLLTVVPLRGWTSMRRLQVDLARSTEYLRQSEAIFFIRDPRDRRSAARLHARTLSLVVKTRPRFCRRLRDGLDAGTRRDSARRTSAHRNKESRYFGLSRIFVRASRRDNRVVNVRVGEMLWKSFAEKFFSGR